VSDTGVRHRVLCFDLGVAIKVSAAREIDTLIGDLAGPSAVRRDAAVARLTVIGARAVDRLVALAASDASASARIAALRALDGIGDVRGLDTALVATHDADPGVAITAIALTRAFLFTERSPDVVDHLTAVAVDTARPDRVRVKAIRALKDLDAETIAPLVQSLSSDSHAAVRAEASGSAAPGVTPSAAIERMAADGLPDRADAVRDLIARGGTTAALPALLRVVERVRDREATEPPDHRAAWATARAAAHLALARRESRVALYDLREWLEASISPLPVDAIAALALIGEASCLEPIAASCAQSHDAWWQDRLRDTFHTIAERDGLTRRHAVGKRIEKRWPAVAKTLWR